MYARPPGLAGNRGVTAAERMRFAPAQVLCLVCNHLQIT